MEKNIGGRPTKYDPKFNEQAYKLCLLGATDVELADFFEVTEPTICHWKAQYPEFLISLRDGKQVADAVIASKLFHRAKGYEHVETITATFQGKITDTMDVIKHYPPDTTAAIFWLKNRKPEVWRDKQEVEHTGPNGGPLLMQDITSLSDDDLKRIIEIMEKGLLTGEVIDIEESK